jgi:hypothetical protein
MIGGKGSRAESNSWFWSRCPRPASVLLVIVFLWMLAACNGRISETTTRNISVATVTQTLAPPSPTAADNLSPTMTPMQAIATASAPPALTSVPAELVGPVPINPHCPLGIGLNQQTAPLLEQHVASNGMVMTASPELASVYFPRLDGWLRVLGAPNLDGLQQKAARALSSEIPYEALAYGLETGPGTPDEEWRDLAGSSSRAAVLAAQYGKKLVMGPGYRLMERNVDAYAPMAGVSDVWMLQTQQLQKDPPGDRFRQEVEQIVAQLSAANPNIEVWAQITLPPGRQPDAAEWLAYRAEIADLVTGAYIGVYTWDLVDTETLLAVVDTIFGTVCGETE